MNLQQPGPILLVLVGLALLGAAGLLQLPSVAAGSRPAGTDDATRTKIARAMSAGPDDIARSARIIDTTRMEILSFYARAATVSPACPAIPM
jgi:hypothetical protein